jgi:hypothetical protein
LSHFPQDVIGDGLGHQPQIAEGKGLTDYGSPTIGTEFNSQNIPPFMNRHE